MKTYFTGHPCKHGHIASRRLDNRTCVECQRLRSKKFRSERPQYFHQYNIKYYATHKERAAESSSQYYARERATGNLSHRQRINHAAYRRRHIEKIRQRNREWLKNNSDWSSAQSAKRRATILRAIPKWVSLVEIREIYERCSLINKDSKEKHVVDHIVPLQGKNVCGLHVENNLQIITEVENATKANKHEQG